MKKALVFSFLLSVLMSVILTFLLLGAEPQSFSEDGMASYYNTMDTLLVLWLPSVCTSVILLALIKWVDGARKPAPTRF